MTGERTKHVDTPCIICTQYHTACTVHRTGAGGMAHNTHAVNPSPARKMPARFTRNPRTPSEGRKETRMCACVYACGRPRAPRNRRPSCIHRGPGTRALSADDRAPVGVPFIISPTAAARSNVHRAAAQYGDHWQWSRR